MFQLYQRKKSLSGYMIVRNVVSQGYPYLEAIRSALPICDEFLIADGCSEDGTWQGLEQLRSQYPKKIRLYREPWEGSTVNGEILAVMSNRLLEKCSGDYCLNLQANEVLPSGSLEQISRLTKDFPKIALFRLPFLSIMGKDLSWMVEQRGRLFRRQPDIVSLADAYDVGFIQEEGKEVMRFTATLPYPIHRYRGLYPVNYLRKMEGRMNLFTSEHARYYTQKELNFTKQTLAAFDQTRDHPDLFWKQIRTYFEKEMWENNPDHLQLDSYIPHEMLGFQQTTTTLVSGLPDQWEYNLEDSLKLLTKELPQPQQPTSLWERIRETVTGLS